MRGTVAKRLRNTARKISKPTEAKVKWYKKLLRHSTKTVDVATIRLEGYRRVYQDMKRDYKRS